MAKNVFSESPVDTFTRDLQSKSFELPDLSEVRREQPKSEPSAGKLDIEYNPDDLKSPEPLRPIFDNAASTYGVPGDILQALAQQESSYRTDAIGVDTPWGRAKGIMQYIDPTAESLGINPFDPEQSINAAAGQFGARIANGYSIEEAIMAHHGGDDRRQWGPKTRQYAKDVMKKAGLIGNNANAYGGDEPPAMIAREGTGYDPSAREPESVEELADRTMRDTLPKQDTGPVRVQEGWSVKKETADGEKPKANLRFTRAKPEDMKPEDYDSFTEATGKELRNLDENFIESAGGLLELFGDDMADDRERGFANAAQRMGLTPEEFKLVYWAESNDLISDDMKSGKDIKMTVELLKDQLGGIDNERIQQAVVDAGLLNPERIAGFGREVRQSQEGQKEQVNAEPGSMAFYGSQAIRSVAENMPALAMSVATRNPVYALGDIGARTTGRSYGEAKDKGLSTEKAREYATTMALAEIIPSTIPVGRFISIGSGITRKVPGGEFVKKLLGKAKDKIPTNVQGFMGDTFTEGAQEAVTAMLQAGIDQDFIDPDMSLSDALKQIAEGAIIGSLAGAGMSGSIRGGTAAVDKARGGEQGKRGRALAAEIERGNEGEFSQSDIDRGARESLNPERAQMEQVRPSEQAEQDGFGDDVMQGRSEEEFNESFDDSRLDGRTTEQADEAPEGPLSRATQDAARESQLEAVKGDPVKVRTQTGVIDGIVSEYTEDGRGNFNARILDQETGELYEYTQDDPVEITRIAASRQEKPEELLQPRDMSTSEIMEELENLDLNVDRGKSVQQAKSEQQRAQMLQQEMQDRGLDMGGQSTDPAQMNEQQLRGQLKQLAQQGKQQGWTKELLDERKKIEGFIDEIGQAGDQDGGIDDGLLEQADQAANVDRADQQLLNAQPEGPPASTGERRKNPETRRRVAEMSQEEMQEALLQDDLTGLGNRRAYEENERKPVQVSVDADSLKWVNDNMSHTAGDQMLQAIGDAFKMAQADAYHPSGDEFWMQANTEEEAEAIMQQVAAELEQAEITIRLPNGELITKKGIGLSYGTGKTIEEAEPRLQAQKAERERTGNRAGRGETPPGVTRSGSNPGISGQPAGRDGNRGSETAERPQEEAPEVTTKTTKQDKARQRAESGDAWFGSRDKAQDFLTKNKLESEFGIEPDGQRFTIKPLDKVQNPKSAPEGRQLRNDGQPFANQALASNAMKNRRLQGYQVTQVEGGYALDPVQEEQGETEAEATQEAAQEEGNEGPELTAEGFPKPTAFNNAESLVESLPDAANKKITLENLTREEAINQVGGFMASEIPFQQEELLRAEAELAEAESNGTASVTLRNRVKAISAKLEEYKAEVAYLGNKYGFTSFKEFQEAYLEQNGIEIPKRREPLKKDSEQPGLDYRLKQVADRGADRAVVELVMDQLDDGKSLDDALKQERVGIEEVLIEQANSMVPGFDPANIKPLEQKLIDKYTDQKLAKVREAVEEQTQNWTERYRTEAERAGLRVGKGGFGATFKTPDGKTISASITRNSDGRVRAGGKRYNAMVTQQQGSVKTPSVTKEFDTVEEALQSLEERNAIPAKQVTVEQQDTGLIGEKSPEAMAAMASALDNPNTPTIEGGNNYRFSTAQKPDWSDVGEGFKARQFIVTAPGRAPKLTQEVMSPNGNLAGRVMVKGQDPYGYIDGTLEELMGGSAMGSFTDFFKPKAQRQGVEGPAQPLTPQAETPEQAIARTYRRKVDEGKAPEIADWLQDENDSLKVVRIPTKELGAGRVRYAVVDHTGARLDTSGTYMSSEKGATKAAKEEAASIVEALDLLRYGPGPMPGKKADSEAKQSPAEPEITDITVDTFNSWKRQGTAGRKGGWTIFDDTRVRDQFVLMRKVTEANEAGGGFESAQMVSGFKTKDQATKWAATNTAKAMDAQSRAEQSIEQQSQSQEWGADNTLVTRERAEELRKKLRAKLGQMNSGIDPEILAAGTELAVYHLEAGARKFARFARAIAADLGTNPSRLRPYLRSWYNGARDMMEDNGLSIEGTDDAATVREAIQNIEALNSPETESLEDALYESFEDIGNNRQLKRVVADFYGLKPADVTGEQMKDAQERLEAAITRKARDIVEAGEEVGEIYNELVELYNNQPNLNVRSSTSMQNQAYSTPAPLAYLASLQAGIDPQSTVYEPTAGNGMLLIGADPELSTVNELNDLRAEQLRAQGFTVTQNDATEFVPEESVDSVIANPPFGRAPEKTKVDGFNLVQIDHIIAAKALQAMDNNGNATLIIGANKDGGEMSAADRVFFNWLYSNYNVDSHFEVDGKLYQRQGAGWPVRVISINGRQKSNRNSSAAQGVERADNWGRVYELFNENMDAREVGTDAGRAEGTDSAPATGQQQTQEPGTAQGSPGIQAGTTDNAGTGGRGQRSGTAANNSGSGPRSGNPGRVRGESEPAGRRTDGSGQPVNDGRQGRPEQRDGERGSESGVRAPGSQGVPTATGQSDTGVAAGSDFQVAYKTKSGGFNDAVLTPVNMAEATDRALETIRQEVGGDLDQYVMDQLGYESKEALYDAFMGLQIDAVAAGIYNIENGKGQIIADQTGVGKGRQAAAIIRYALKKGKTPIFVTVKDNLFTDMYNDLADIGTTDAMPFILNQDGKVKSPDGDLFTNDKRPKHVKEMRGVIDTGMLPPGRNMLFMTYSQVNKDNVQRQVVEALRENAVFILDESHNAAGEREKVDKKGTRRTTAGFIYDAIDQTPVQYLSATYAKTPDNMPVYYRTDLMSAVDSAEELIEAVTAGGAPLQTVVSGMLAESGQLFRRERSFDGISVDTVIDTKRKKEHERISDTVTEGLRAIVAADKMFHTVTVGQANESAKEGGGLAAGGGNQAGKGVDHTHFTSVVHNFIGQMLMGLHAESTIDRAISMHQKGIKPVIALDKTMGSFLVRYAEQNGLQQGDAIDADYRDILRYALDRTRGINYTLPNGEKETRYLTMDELTPEVRAEYDKALAVIDSLDVDLPISPIDYVRNRLSEAGIEVAEITGRGTIIDYSSGRPVLAKRPNEEITDRRGTVDKFNGGELDALILNQAGSTGLSIHSAEKFADTKPRHMVVMQPMGDINILMQMLGRVNRTGQVNKPGYTMIGADIPAEKRPLARTAQKMKSLNANTSANTESDTSVEAADILNKYGDRIVNDYLKDNLDVARMVDISPTSSDDGSAVMVAGLAAKFTGRMALLPTKLQGEIYEEIEAQYTNYIEYLNKTNQNDLETTVIDYQAKVIESKVSYEGIAPETIFGGNTVVHKADVKYQGKPPTPEEVEADLTKAGNPETVREQILQKKEQDTAAMDNIRDRVKERKREYDDLVAQGAEEKAVEEAQEKLEAAASQLQAYEANKRNVVSQIIDFSIGRRVQLEIEGQNVTGVVTGIKDNHKPGKGNPYARSKTVVSMAVPLGIRQIDLPLSQLGFGNIFQGFAQGQSGQNSLQELFKPDLAGNDRREVRYIATGNLIAGMAKLPGRIISFTDADGGIRQGILLPRSYNQGKDASFSNMDETVGFPIRDAAPLANYIRRGLDGLKNDPLFDTSKEIAVTSVKGRPAIQVPRSNKGATTKQVKFSQELMDAMGTEFFGSGKYMTAQFDLSRVDQVAEALLNLVTLQGRPSQRRDWIAAGGKPRPKVANSFDTGTSRETGRKPMLKRGAVQNDKQSRADQLQTVQSVTNSWRNGPRVVTVDKLSDLPTELKDYIKEQGAEQDFTGVYWEGAMYLYMPNIPDGNALEATIIHEGIGHYGVMGFLGPQFDGVAQQIFQEFRGTPEAKRIIAEYFTEEKFSATKPEHRIRVGAELLAHLSESKGHQKLMDKVLQVIQDILRQMGFRIQPNRRDLNKLLRAGERFVKNGEIAVRNKTDAYFRRDDKAPQITDPMNMPLDQLIEGIPALAERVDQAYDNGDMDTAAELDQLLEAAYVRAESAMFDIEEDGMTLPGSDGPGGMTPQAARQLLDMQGELSDTEPGIEDQVASIYGDYLKPYHYADYDAMVEQVRGVLEEYQRTNGGLEPGLTDQQVADMARDVYNDSEKRRAQGKTGQPMLSRKPNMNNMSKAEREQAQRRALSAAEKGLAGEPDTINGDVISPQIVGDMGRVAKFVLHPRQVATLHKPFTPVYRTAINQFQMRDRIIDSLYGRYQDYMLLNKTQKQNVNKLLELGRIAGRNFLDKKVMTEEGVIVPGFRDTVIQLEDGTVAIAEEPVSLELSKEGDLIKLTEEEFSAYARLRDMFDEALDMFKEQMLIEFGMEQYLGEENATAKIMEDIEADPMMPTKKLERMLQIAKTIEEIEQAKRKGYVPLSRHGDYVVAVKETPEGIQSSDTKDGMKKLDDVPEEFEPMLEALEATPVGDGSWVISPDRYKEFMRNAGRTVYSSKVETGMRDAFSMASLVDKKARYAEIPSVKAEVARVKEQYLKGKPNRTAYAFPVSEIKEKEISLSDVDTLAQLSGIDNDTWDGIREAMEDEIKARGFRRHFFHSDNTPGYSVDFERNISQYISGMGGYLARRKYAPDFDTAIDNIKTARLRTYAENYRNYINDPEEEYAMIRQVGFLGYIAGNLSTAMVNASQVPMLTMPHLAMFSSNAKAAAEVTRAYKDAIKMFRLNRKTGLQIFDPTQAPDDISSELMEAWAEGAFVPLETYEVMATARARGVGQRQFRKKFEKSVQMIAYTFTAVERLNRLVTFIAATRIAKDPKYAGKFRKVLAENNLAMNTLFDNQGNLIPKNFGEFSIDETQYRMGKVNRPPISRGVGAPLMQFKSFMMQTLETFYRWSKVQSREGKLAAASALLMMMNLGGLWGFPGGEDLRDMFEKLWKLFTDEDKDLETDLRLYIYEQTNQRWLSEYVTKGAGGPTLGADMSRIGMGQLVPDTPLDMLGIPADMFIGRPTRAIEQLAQENYAKAGAEFLPQFIANPIQALSWQENGVYTRYGTKLLNKENVTPAIVAKKMIGLNDQRIANIRDSEYAVRRAENALNKKRSRYYASLARAMATSATSTNPDTVLDAEEKINEVFTEIEAINAAAQTEDELIIINESVLNRRIERELLGVEAGFGRGRTTTRGKAERIREAMGVFEALSTEQEADDE